MRLGDLDALTAEMRKSINERYPKWDKPITVADSSEGSVSERASFVKTAEA